MDKEMSFHQMPLGTIGYPCAKKQTNKQNNLTIPISQPIQKINL